MLETPRTAVFGASPVPVGATVERLVGGRAPHGHDFLEFAVIRSGAGRQESAAGSVRLEAGVLVTVRPGHWHGFSGCEELEVLLVYIGTELLAHELSWLRGDPVLGPLTWPTRRAVHEQREVRLDTQSVEALAGPVARLAAEPSSEPGERARRLGDLLRVFGVVAPFLDQGEPPPTEVTLTLDALEADPARAWTLADLATIVRCSPQHLTRLYARHIGIAPLQCLLRLRAERMAAALTETDQSVAEIGRRVGWTDPAYASPAVPSVLRDVAHGVPRPNVLTRGGAAQAMLGRAL